MAMGSKSWCHTSRSKSCIWDTISDSHHFYFEIIFRDNQLSFQKALVIHTKVQIILIQTLTHTCVCTILLTSTFLPFLIQIYFFKLLSDSHQMAVSCACACALKPCAINQLSTSSSQCLMVLLQWQYVLLQKGITGFIYGHPLWLS